MKGKKPIAERFWPKVNKTDTCWLWTGATNTLGYGQIAAECGGGKRSTATAVSWFLATGAYPQKGVHLCHRCDIPSCVNPAHLFLGTARDNMGDCIQKGRFKFLTPRHGILNNKAKLTPGSAAAIRSAYASGVTISALSRAYGLARSTVREVTNGRNWRIDPTQPRPARKARSNKLSALDVRAIRAGRACGLTRGYLAKEFGVDPATIQRRAW